jgi:hypothetical protein
MTKIAARGSVEGESGASRTDAFRASGRVEARALAMGEALTGIGVWLPRGAIARGRGASVRVEGDAVDGGVLACVRAQAWPLGASVPPWAAAGWEHALLRGADGALGAWLRAVDAEARGVWVGVRGYAAREGVGGLTISVRSGDGDWSRALDVTVAASTAPPRETRWFEGWHPALAVLDREVRTLRRQGILRVGASFAWRAVLDRAPGERTHRVRLASGRLLFSSASARSLLRSARRGTFATVELRREPGAMEGEGSFEVTLARRRGSSGLWGVEFVRRTSVGLAR